MADIMLRLSRQILQRAIETQDVVVRREIASLERAYQRMLLYTRDRRTHRLLPLINLRCRS